MSAPSEPFIVCTNIKQWVKSEGTILKVTHGTRLRHPLTAVARRLRRLYASGLGALRCDDAETRMLSLPRVRTTHAPQFFLTVGSQRGLSPEDLQAIHTRLGGQELVHKSVFSEFFSTWYGPILKLAYQKPGRVLWEKRCACDCAALVA